jgi:hypothetical protein
MGCMPSTISRQATRLAPTRRQRLLVHELGSGPSARESHWPHRSMGSCSVPGVSATLVDGDLPPEVARAISTAGRVAVDTETSGLEWARDQLHLCQLFPPATRDCAVAPRRGIAARNCPA